MKNFLAIVLVAALMPSARALAGSPPASPLIGSWAVDVSRVPRPPQERPKSVTITFADAGNGKWATQVDVVGRDGSKNHSEGTSALDGTPSPVEGNFEADVAAVKMPEPGVLVMVLAKDRIPGSIRVYTVDAGGKSMVETAAYYGQNGSPITRTNYFTRIR